MSRCTEKAVGKINQSRSIKAFTEYLEIIGLQNTCVFFYFIIVGVCEILTNLMGNNGNIRDKLAASVAERNGLYTCAVLYLDRSAAAFAVTDSFGTDKRIIAVVGIGSIGLDMTLGSIAHCI